MFSKAPTGTPRHMAGSKRSDRTPHTSAAAPAHLLSAEVTEVPPASRVHRSRLAFAVSATLAALPILVLDNFPATAEPARTVEAVGTADVAADDEAAPTSIRRRSTTSAAAPTTSVAPTSSEAPTTTVAPPAPEEASIQRLTAPDVAEPSAPTTTAAPAPTVAAEPAPQPARPSGQPGDPDDPATWDRLAECESHGNWGANTGNGYYGGLQFSLASWRDVGGTGYPHEHSREEQILRGRMLQARYGWGQWPTCSEQLGYR